MTADGFHRASFACALAFLILSLASGCVRNPLEEAREHRARADVYLQASKFREASLEYQSAIQKDPSDAEAHYGLAKTLEALGEFVESREGLRKVLALAPGHPGACVGMAGLLQIWGNYGEALELARRVPDGTPQTGEARKIEALALAGLGRIDESRALWERLLAGAPQDGSMYAEAANFEAGAGDLSRAREVLQQGIEQLPEAMTLRLVLADVLALSGKPDEAEKALLAAEGLEPEEPRIYAARARFLIREGKVRQGFDASETAQKRFANDEIKGPEMALEDARLHMVLGDLAGAASTLKKARGSAPDHPGLAATLADVLISQGRAGEARALLPLAVKFDPTGRIPRLLEARLHLADGHVLWAMSQLESLVAKGDMSLETHLLYARALASSKRWASALREYRFVLQRSPEHLLARLDYVGLLGTLGDHRAALSLLDALPAQIGTSPRVKYLRAQMLVGAGQTAEARRIVMELLTSDSGNTVVLTLMGDVERADRNHQKALEFYKKARGLSPKAVEPLLGQAAAMRERGDPIRDVARLLMDYQDAQGESAVVLHRLASLQLEDGDLAAATESAERSFSIEPDYSPSRVLFAKILVAEGEFPQATAELERTINRDPLDPDAYNSLAEIHKMRGETSRAEETYRRLLERNPGEPQTANNLANLYLDQGRPDEALRLAQEAYAGAPENPYVMDTLGYALELSGRSEEAAGLLEQAVRRLESHPDVLLHWGLNLQSRGKAEAKEVLERVAALAPTSRSAARAREALGRAM